MSSARLPLLRACSGILPSIEKIYSAPGLHKDFENKEKAARLTSLLTRDELREIVQGITHYAVFAVLPFFARSIDRSIGFVERCSLSRMDALYAEMANTKLLEREAVRGWRVS